MKTAATFTELDVSRLREHADWYEEQTTGVIYACPEEDMPAWQLRNLAERIEVLLWSETDRPL